MNRVGNGLLIGAAAFFTGFFANVASGAFGMGTVLSDVGEMLVLFAACILFVISLLIKERAAKSKPE